MQAGNCLLANEPVIGACKTGPASSMCSSILPRQLKASGDCTLCAIKQRCSEESAVNHNLRKLCACSL